MRRADAPTRPAIAMRGVQWPGVIRRGQQGQGVRGNSTGGIRNGIFRFVAVLAASAGGAQAHVAPAMHAMLDVVFDVPARLARAEVLLDRTMTPLALERVREAAAAAGKAVHGDSIDLADERFSLYVPTAAAPAAGYGLLVFVPPWDEARIPAGWLPVLARHATILVVAARSGNGASVLARRMPLALAGYENVGKRYRLDPARIHVGGFSGGSRVAQRLALAFPDVFRGAILNAGSDPFGSSGVSPPQASLLRRFEEHARLVYATGSKDVPAEASDRRSRASARTTCVGDIVTLPMHNRGHEPLDARTLDRALTALAAPHKPAAGIEDCRRARASEMARQLAAVQQRLDASDLRGAGKRLDVVDVQYGGLALPTSLEIAHRLRAARIGLPPGPG